VQNLRQGADPERARPGQERQGISLIKTLKGRRHARSSISANQEESGEQLVERISD
jgi:hypothetical protein